MAEESDLRSGHVEACGAPLYYEVAGSGAPLVLIHEGIADLRMYDDQLGAFARDHRVVRYDLHRFGRSGAPTQPFSHHEALRALLDQLGIERTALLGMSMGGGVAIDFTLTYPDRVGALCLLAAGVGGYPNSPETVAFFTPLREAFQAGDFARAIDLSVRIWVDGPQRQPEEVNPVVRERIRSMYTEVLRRSRDGGPPATPLDPPAYTRLSDIHAPTLVVVGAGDVPAVVEQADLIARSVPGARHVVLPRVAHVLNMEIPAEVNQIVLDFLHERYAVG
jgi:pimeloyl-ACP methyl ester carboxylesterase